MTRRPPPSVVFVATKVARLDHYVRQHDGSWVRRSAGPGGEVPLSAVSASLPVDDVYEKVFDAG